MKITDEKIIASGAYFLPCVRRHFGDDPIVFVEAEGAVLKDSNGKKYLDTLCSHGCATLIGYNHPAVIEAVKEQAGRLYSMAVEYNAQPVVELAERLLQVVPKDFRRVYFANAGAEAVEVALFLAKKYTKK